MRLGFHHSIISARNKQMKLLAAEEQLLFDILKQAEKDLVLAINRLYATGGSRVTKALYKARRREIHAIIELLQEKLANRVIKSSSEAASFVVEDYDRLFRRRLKDAGINLAVTFDAVPMNAVVAAMSIRRGGIELNRSLYNFGKYAKADLDAIITGGISRGQSAADMTRSVRKFFREGDTFTAEELADLRTVKGAARRDMASKLNYKAKRLTRSSINNSYHEAHVQCGNIDPTVLGQKWNLSASHPKVDVCDLLAGQDSFGLGKGVYPSNHVPPRPHPNDLCYLTSLMRDPEDWEKPKPDIKIKKGWKKIRVKGIKKSDERMFHDSMDVAAGKLPPLRIDTSRLSLSELHEKMFGPFPKLIGYEFRKGPIYDG